jgi:hypothetical protein
VIKVARGRRCQLPKTSQVFTASWFMLFRLMSGAGRALEWFYSILDLGYSFGL